MGIGALNGDITISGLSKTSVQGDKEIVSLLEKMGVSVVQTAQTFRVTNHDRLRAIDVDLTNIPDLFPLLCALLMHAKGTSTLFSLQRLQWKECDRLQACLCMIHALGGEATIQGDSMIIHGVEKASGGALPLTGDHRMVMAGAIASSRCLHPSTLQDEKAVAKSYPTFFTAFRQLGGIIA